MFVIVHGLGKFVVDRSADPSLSTTRHPTKLVVTNVAKRLISDDCVTGYTKFFAKMLLRKNSCARIAAAKIAAVQ